MAYGPVFGLIVFVDSMAVEKPIVESEDEIDEPFKSFSVGGPEVPVTSFNAAATSGLNAPVIPDAVKREE